MIDEKFRFWVHSTPPDVGLFRGPNVTGFSGTWQIVDLDQRRVVDVTILDLHSARWYQLYRDVIRDITDEIQSCLETRKCADVVVVGYLGKHIDALGPDVYRVRLSPDGELISVSTNPEDDQTTCDYYLPLQSIVVPDGVGTVLRSDLLELDRFGPTVDLVSYHSCARTSEAKAVFKYYFNNLGPLGTWAEMNLCMRLPPHPNLVPMGRPVLDELHGGVVGFTTRYIPGGTIKDNTSRTFKLEWLRQLTQVVDDLNFKHGIIHQDVAPRNILVDPESDALMLFDFGCSGWIGDNSGLEHRDDVGGVILTLYEITTRDEHFRENDIWERRDAADEQGLEEWVQHPDVKLDHPVSEYRLVLNEWVKQRREGKQLVAIYTEAPECIDWPDFPELPAQEETFVNAFGRTKTRSRVRWCERRSDLRKKAFRS